MTATMKLVPIVVLLLAQVLTSSAYLPMDCSDFTPKDNERIHGVYTIFPNGEKSSGVQVYCDYDENGSWTVFQRRMDGTVNFYRDWNQYRLGFGKADGEYWLGLDNIHHLTHKKRYELKVTMEDFTGKKVFSRYTSFSVDGECDKYELHVSGFVDGGAGDSLSKHNQQKFTTYDRDHDTSSRNCASEYLGAFWYYCCLYTNPNGVYIWGENSKNYARGVFWKTFEGYYYSMKKFSMQIRPVK